MFFLADFQQGAVSDDLSDTHDLTLLDPKPDYYASLLNPGFFPSLPASNAHPDSKILDLENGDALDVEKRISRFMVDPHSKRWSQMVRVPPKVYREFRNGNNGQRLRTFFRRDFPDNGFKMSYGSTRKRPYYYTEPEGSEFLGGPGK